MVDQMLRTMGHAQRVSRVTGIFSLLWGDNAIDVSSNANFGGRVLPVPNGLRPVLKEYYSDQQKNS